MGFSKVYKSLQELFPQIDARVLRAVAIEHSKDADAAVEAVLEEIIPFFTERSKPSSPLTGSISAEQNGHTVHGGSQQSVRDNDDGHNETFLDAYDEHHEASSNVSQSAFSDQTKGGRIIISADANSHGEPVVLIEKNGLSTPHTEVSSDHEAEQTFVDDNFPASCLKAPSASTPCHTSETLQDVNTGVDESMNCVHNYGEIDNHLENAFCMDTKQENDPESSRAVGNNYVDDLASLATDDRKLSTLENSVQLVAHPEMHQSYLKEVFSSTDNAFKVDTGGKIVGSTDESSISASMSQSRQMRIIDVLEEIIADARNNKKTLFSAMESVISLMREVEDKEKAADQAKEEAATAGTYILDKVEELNNMLRHAREANDMHAGEVYGEKAILATELRELQSRVLSLSDERDKSLSVLDEMQSTLEMRLAAAENEIKSAEQVKLEKEKSARKALADQELIMAKVVEEANILKQQAEDNAKLQEFLVDRGRIVDMLQGELAVICQDVKLLKEKFDENVPFSKSVSSSQTSCILASSSSSMKSLIPDQVETVAESPDPLKIRMKDQSFSINEYASEVKVVKDDGKDLLEDHKELVEDGWEIF